MTDLTSRLFESDAAIHRIGEGLLDRSLPRAEWTHEAHLAACLWLVRERPDINPETRLRAIISLYNEAAGGVNDDTQGYHETITQCFLWGVRAHHATHHQLSLIDAVNALLLSHFGKRDWPLEHYSRARLFSVEARRRFIAPDLAPLPAQHRFAGSPKGADSGPV